MSPPPAHPPSGIQTDESRDRSQLISSEAARRPDAAVHGLYHGPPRVPPDSRPSPPPPSSLRPWSEKAKTRSGKHAEHFETNASPEPPTVSHLQRSFTKVAETLVEPWAPQKSEDDCPIVRDNALQRHESGHH